MSKPLALYPCDRVHCPDCGSVLNLFTQAEGYSLHTCSRSTGNGSCGQQMIVLGAAGGSAVVVPISSGEGERLRQLLKRSSTPNLRRILADLGVYEGSAGSAGPQVPPLGG